MAGVLNDTFGGPVIWQNRHGGQQEIIGIFREQPVASADDADREILVIMPTLSVQRPLADEIERGDLIIAPNGKTYRVLNRHPGGSPAADALVIIELEIFA